MRRGGRGGVNHRREAGEGARCPDQRHGSLLLLSHLGVPVRGGRGHVDHHQGGDQIRRGDRQLHGGQPSEDMPTTISAWGASSRITGWTAAALRAGP